jgi:hypothetical protein
MTTQQLRKRLKDEQEKDWHLTEAPDCQDEDPPGYPAIRIHPVQPQPPEISTESR